MKKIYIHALMFFLCMMIAMIVVGLPQLIFKDQSMNEFNELWLVTILAYMLLKDRVEDWPSGKVRVKK